MTINEMMTAERIPNRPYTIAAQLAWAEAEINDLRAELDRLRGGLHSHGWRNIEPCYNEDGYDVGDCGDAGLAVEDRLRSGGWR